MAGVNAPNHFGYWIPALPRRARPGSLGRTDRQRCLRRDATAQSSEPNAMALRSEGGALRAASAASFSGRLQQRQQSPQQLGWPRWAAADVQVDRDHVADAANHGVAS